MSCLPVCVSALVRALPSALLPGKRSVPVLSTIAGYHRSSLCERSFASEFRLLGGIYPRRLTTSLSFVLSMMARLPLSRLCISRCCKSFGNGNRQLQFPWRIFLYICCSAVAYFFYMPLPQLPQVVCGLLGFTIILFLLLWPLSYLAIFWFCFCTQ